MNTILALDSSSENCSAAVLHQHVMSLNSEHAPRKHTQLILPMMKQALLDRSLHLDDIDAVAFGAGPGSFTGIRIAAGVAQGLAYGLDVPIFAVSNLKALALQSYFKNKSEFVLATIDARMDEVYWGLLQVSEHRVQEHGLQFTRYNVKALSKELVSSPSEVTLPSELTDVLAGKKLAGIGTGIALLGESITQLLTDLDKDAQPNADSIAFLAETEMSNGALGELKNALPSYVRDTVTWNKLPGR